MVLRRAPAECLREHVMAYWGFEERTEGAMRRREGPGSDVVVILSFGNEWLIDDERRGSFVGGLRRSQVTTEHAGWSCGMHIGLVPLSAYALLGIPMHELAETTVPLEELLPSEFVGRLADTASWDERFALLDEVLARRLVNAHAVSPGVMWAWERLRSTHGQVRVGSLTEELGWSRKRLIARFREQIGLSPKAVARLLRFERARSLAEAAECRDWPRIAVECGYYDQSHLINDFRAVTGKTPATFFQDTVAATP